MCWKITSSIFFSILLVEAVILLPSYRNYERDELTRLSMISVGIIQTMFSALPIKPSSTQIQNLGKEISTKTILKGAIILNQNGKELAHFGEMPMNPIKNIPKYLQWFSRVRTEDGNRFDSQLNEDQLGIPYQVIVRMDSSDIQGKLIAFILRIAGLVLIIATAVTIVTLFVFRKSVLNPILALRDHLEEAKNNPTNPENFRIIDHRADELGEVFDKFNGMAEASSKYINIITDRENELKKIKMSLEEEIKTRTQELQLTNTKLKKEILERQTIDENMIILARFPDENPHPVFRASENGVLLYANAGSSPLLKDLEIEIGDKLPLKFRKIIKESIVNNSPITMEKACNDKFYTLVFAPVREYKYINIYGVDSTERKRYEERLFKLTNYDLVTELPNKTLFIFKLKESIEFAKLKNKKLLLLIIDLNDVHEISNSYGETIYDLYVKDISQMLINNIPKSSVIGRISNEQIAISHAEHQGEAQALNLAEWILDILSRPLSILENNILSTINIGISIFPQDGINAETLISNANIALERAKTEVKNSYQFYEIQMNKKLEFKKTMLVDLHYATEQKQFVLYYQPIVDLKNEKVISCEALIRWLHPERGLISPLRFIPLAEESGLIIHIGEWVLRTACSQMRRLHNDGLTDLHVSVNVSPIQLRKKDFPEIVNNILFETQIKPEFLVLEITESSLMTDTTNTINAIKSLHSLGIQLSIDDFGTGYSSLSLLKKFPIQTIKIDQYFVKDIIEKQTRAHLIDAIIYLGHNLGLSVLAEGVETEEQKLYLKENGCDLAQGSFYSHPLGFEDFIIYIRNHLKNSGK